MLENLNADLLVHHILHQLHLLIGVNFASILIGGGRCGHHDLIGIAAPTQLAITAREVAIEGLNVGLHAQIVQMVQSIKVQIGAQGARDHRTEVKHWLLGTLIDGTKINRVLIETWRDEDVLLDEIGNESTLYELVFEQGKLFEHRTCHTVWLVSTGAILSARLCLRVHKRIAACRKEGLAAVYAKDVLHLLVHFVCSLIHGVVDGVVKLDFIHCKWILLGERDCDDVVFDEAEAGAEDEYVLAGARCKYLVKSVELHQRVNLCRFSLQHHL